ncbi:uncharacterized protein AB675_8604 [Cyphellophora attinorum]|uniref:Uncharacterized protein n=1 Tax=Cyphellophora attinorum TaxID=1664694 RepID=A0A0N0NR42_9EURO|nr:uncharacterized protein AB675_8604 [Phialophora attinorum]KPI44661.1 hypothetical protein AB675_8604 [Phialophora attinorum]
MGLSDRRPILPAPTDSSIGAADEAPPSPEQDVATDLSRLTDRTHHTIPDDGTPITIPTSLKHLGKGNPAQQSQASLLIEYFENNSDPERKPSIRVRVAPSGSKKLQQTPTEHISLPATLRHNSISLHRLGSDDSEGYNMTTQRLSRPFEPEFQQPSEISVLSDSPPTRFMAPESDVSSMPADSMLGVSNTAIDATRLRTSGKENQKPTDRNPISDRLLTQKVIEKLAAKPRSSGLKTTSEGRRSSASHEIDASRPRRRTAKHIEDDSITGSSMISGSAVSDMPKSNDGRSVRSGQSQVSSTNPRLIQTVENAIRKLIIPELEKIRSEQKHATHRKHRKEYPTDLSESSISREELSQRKSSGKSRRRSSTKDEHRVSSSSRRHERSHKTVDDTPSERSYDKSESISSVSVEEDLKARKSRKSHRARDAAAAGLAGAALTAAALKHHDSSSSVEHRERRKKRSKSRSTRTESIAEDEEVFYKHNVPPMPFRSEVDSTLTRSSLLSSNTAGTMTPTRRDVRRVARGSPGELQSPVSDSPSQTPVEKDLPQPAQSIQTGLGTHHGNFSNRDLSGSREDVDVDEDDEEDSHFTGGGYGLVGHGLLTDPERARAYERNLHQQHPIRRGLSPIQSVASYATTEPTRNSLIQARSRETLSSPNKDVGRVDDISEVSYSEILQPYKEESTSVTRDVGGLDSLEDANRDSFASSDARVSQARSIRTDDSIDSPYIDKVTAGQQVGYGFAANPEFINGSEGPESAVASLVEASVLESRAGYSPTTSYKGSPELRGVMTPGTGRRSGSPLRHEHDVTAHSDPRDVTRGIVPPVVFAQSHPRSSEKVAVIPVKTSLPAEATNGEAQDATSPESEITTNPSVIQGPMGYTPGDTSHWPYGPTPPPIESPLAPGTGRSLGVTAPELVPEPLSMSHGPEQKRDVYINRAMEMTPPGAKDEGYETGANAPSPAIIPGKQQLVPKGLPFSQELAYEDDALDNDPFTSQKRDQYASGLSHGMSPLYDNATGRATDRIYDKDIRALMDHLTVRDAQRNARDTEILITLVRTAAEMRNSFEDMKNLMAEQGENMLEENSKQHQQTQKAIGGPRPQPASARVTRTPTLDEEELSTKRRSVFRRVMGLGNKNTQELQNIESMLVQLLDGFEDMRAQQNGHVVEPRLTSIHSADNARAPTDTGYEPEGQAGTSSTGDRSGMHSNNSSRQADYRGYNIRHEPGNRVSTVMEREEEYDYDDAYAEDQQRTPLAAKFTRGASEPVHTPPTMHDAKQGTLSNEHTPRFSNDTSSGRKHKSFASSLLPKMVSRWSKTTASSGDYRASTLQKPRSYSQVSQSGSNVGGYDYDPAGEDALLTSDERYRTQENRPPSPLIPSQVSDSSPKYQGFRNSVNLQHPQPRAGPTERYQNHLNSVAQYYDNNDPISPGSVSSSQWEAQAAMTGMPGADLHQGYQHGGQLSPIFDDGTSQRSSRQGPPRPPKEPQDDPLVPPRPPKVVMSLQVGADSRLMSIMSPLRELAVRLSISCGYQELTWSGTEAIWSSTTVYVRTVYQQELQRRYQLR